MSSSPQNDDTGPQVSEPLRLQRVKMPGVRAEPAVQRASQDSHQANGTDKQISQVARCLVTQGKMNDLSLGIGRRRLFVWSEHDKEFD